MFERVGSNDTDAAMNHVVSNGCVCVCVIFWCPLERGIGTVRVTGRQVPANE